MKGIECYSINKIRSLGLINGKSERYFDSGGLITRQEVAVIIKNTIEYLNGEEYVKIDLPFTDKAKIAPWAIDSVGYVYSKDIINGIGKDKFEPLGFFTFEQAYIIIDRLFN